MKHMAENIITDNMVSFNLESVPNCVRDDVARSILEAVTTYFSQPGVEEAFQEWLSNRAAKKKGIGQGGNHETKGN